MIKPFLPVHAGTALIDVSASSQRVAIPQAGKCSTVRVMNNGSATVWVEFGNSTVAASLTTGFPVGPGMSQVFTGSIGGVSSDPLYVAVIAAAATGKIYFTAGDGVQ